MRSQIVTVIQRRFLFVALLLLGVAACSGEDSVATPTQVPAPTPTSTPATEMCTLPPPFCGGEFPLNTLQTTPYGPPWANVVLPDSFIPCFGPYALCYYADCADTNFGSVSACPCFEWFGTNFVDVNGILNLDSYLATKRECAADPSLCGIPNGAQVCRDLNSGSFLPGAQRFSTFSFYKARQEPIGSTDCTAPPGLYAGCMTAPCFGPLTSNPEDRTATLLCDCPNWFGPFQVGKDGQTCEITPDTWSAAYNPAPPPNPCDLVGVCVPDAPEDSCGCPLFDPGKTMLPPDSGVNCTAVCEEYTNCLRNDEIQLGFTCDATLCTSQDHDLVFDACLGLQNCDLTEIFKAEKAAECSCCASQLCNCESNMPTNAKISDLNARQRANGDVPQCDINGTLCGLAK